MDPDGRTPPLPEPGPDLVTTIYLPEDAGAPSAARQFVAENSERLGADLIRDAQLLVTEIVTNALRHGRPDITLRVRSRPPGIGIAVTDLGTGQPVVSEHLPAPTQISGRGCSSSTPLPRRGP